MTASDSSSSATSRPDPRRIDLPGDAFPPLVGAFLAGEGRDLLAPVRFLGAGERPGLEGFGAEPDRAEVAQALGEANAQYGHPSAQALAQQLADPATHVVITGQQPGLFGGPLYTLSKAVAAQSWAERLRATGVPAMALFWMATEDHDFRESSRASFFTTEGVETFDLGEDPEPLVPVGLRILGPEVKRILGDLRLRIPGERFGEWLTELGRWYSPEVRFGEAFGRLLVRLMGDRCPLIVDAMLPGLKSLQVPWLKRIVEQRTALTEAFAERDHQIIATGYPLQVKPQPGTSPLFLLDGRQRRRIEWRGPDSFRLRGNEAFKGSVDELLEIIEDEPQRVSPGVRARSAIQDAIFGTCLQVLGPGELSYLPQAAPVFELLEIPAPMVVLRPQVLILDERQLGHAASTGVRLSQLLDPSFDLDSWLAPEEDTSFLASAEERLTALLEKMLEPSLAVDSDLERPWKKTGDQMRKALAAYRNKVTAAASRRDETARARLAALKTTCLPQGKLQERVIASTHFPGKYGDDFVDALFQQIDLDPTKLHVVAP